jgi:TolB protein
LTEQANPYRPGEPVADPAMLFGRQNAADWIELQLQTNARVLVISAWPLIGKTSLIKHIGALQNQPAHHLLVDLSALPLTIQTGNRRTSTQEPVQTSLNTALELVINQLTPQLNLTSFTPAIEPDLAFQPAFALQQLIAQANRRFNGQRLIIYFDDLHRLVTHDKAPISAFLTSLMPLFNEHSRLHLVFIINQDKLKQISHPLLDGAPTFNLGQLTADASINMITVPVKRMLRFDYGVTKRIAEVNSHHPYYLSLFCYNLVNRQMLDGWVNQRDFDSVLAEVLESPIEPFRQLWEESTRAERAVLAGMAAIQGAHGPITYQEITRYLHRQNSAVTAEVVAHSLESLVERGVLAPMGAISYRFHVELLRFWLREHTQPTEIVKDVDWAKAAAQLKPTTRPDKATAPAVIAAAKGQAKRSFWPISLLLTLLLCLLALGGVFAFQFWGLPLALHGTPTAAATMAAQNQAAEFTDPTATPLPPEPTPTPSPTPALVVARILPALTFMGRDVDQSWRVYIMNADGSGVTPLSPEGLDDTAPVWSPNGQKVAFVSQRDGNREIYVMDTECVGLPTGCEQNAVNVTRHPADDWTPAWSPDGKRLAFASLRDGGWEIYTLDTTCLGAPETCRDSLVQLTADGSGNILPVYSPDGRRIAFSSKAEGNWDIYTMSIGGGDLRQITTDAANDLSPAWSPDGSRIAFETNRDGNVEVYVMNANGSSPQNVSNFSQANDHGPAWSPDGQTLVFYANREGNWDIFSTSLDGQTVINLTQTPGRDEQTPAWRP